MSSAEDLSPIEVAGVAPPPVNATPTIQEEDDGVWTKDIEDAFEEALAIYPPCGRRKIILTDEGKMYGRNELIARYIKMRTGKVRSRKQVSSHIQVLARKKQREFTAKAKMATGPGKARSGYAGLSSAEIVSQSIVRERAGSAQDGDQDTDASAFSVVTRQAREDAGAGAGAGAASPSFTMDKFTAYLEVPSGGAHTFFEKKGGATFLDPALEQIDIPQIFDKYPGLRELYHTGPTHAFFLVKFWVDLHYDVLPQSQQSYMGMDSVFESMDGKQVEVISSVISLGKQVAEKVQVLPAIPDEENPGRFIYKVDRAPMCDYLMQFVRKLREQSTLESMNRVLENFTSVVLVRDRTTTQILFCAAFAFEVTPPGYGPRSSVYKLVDSQIDGALAQGGYAQGQ